jgi:hypothetical protein
MRKLSLAVVLAVACAVSLVAQDFESSITVLAREPPRLDRLLWYLGDVPPARIYVPAATLEAYRNAEGWKNG